MPRGLKLTHTRSGEDIKNAFRSQNALKAFFKDIELVTMLAHDARLCAELAQVPPFGTDLDAEVVYNAVAASPFYESLLNSPYWDRLAENELLCAKLVGRAMDIPPERINGIAAIITNLQFRTMLFKNTWLVERVLTSPVCAYKIAIFDAAANELLELNSQAALNNLLFTTYRVLALIGIDDPDATVDQVAASLPTIIATQEARELLSRSTALLRKLVNYPNILESLLPLIEDPDAAAAAFAQLMALPQPTNAEQLAEPPYLDALATKDITQWLFNIPSQTLRVILKNDVIKNAVLNNPFVLDAATLDNAPQLLEAIIGLQGDRFKNFADIVSSAPTIHAVLAHPDAAALFFKGRLFSETVADIELFAKLVYINDYRARIFEQQLIDQLEYAQLGALLSAELGFYPPRSVDELIRDSQIRERMLAHPLIRPLIDNSELLTAKTVVAIAGIDPATVTKVSDITADAARLTTVLSTPAALAFMLQSAFKYYLASRTVLQIFRARPEVAAIVGTNPDITSLLLAGNFEYKIDSFDELLNTPGAIDAILTLGIDFLLNFSEWSDLFFSSSEVLQLIDADKGLHDTALSYSLTAAKLLAFKLNFPPSAVHNLEDVFAKIPNITTTLEQMFADLSVYKLIFMKYVAHKNGVPPQYINTEFDVLPTVFENERNILMTYPDVPRLAADPYNYLITKFNLSTDSYPDLASLFSDPIVWNWITADPEASFVVGWSDTALNLVLQTFPTAEVVSNRYLMTAALHNDQTRPLLQRESVVIELINNIFGTAHATVADILADDAIFWDIAEDGYLARLLATPTWLRLISPERLFLTSALAALAFEVAPAEYTSFAAEWATNTLALDVVDYTHLLSLIRSFTAPVATIYGLASISLTDAFITDAAPYLTHPVFLTKAFSFDGDYNYFKILKVLFDYQSWAEGILRPYALRTIVYKYKQARRAMWIGTYGVPTFEHIVENCDIYGKPFSLPAPLSSNAAFSIYDDTVVLADGHYIKHYQFSTKQLIATVGMPNAVPINNFVYLPDADRWVSIYTTAYCYDPDAKTVAPCTTLSASYEYYHYLWTAGGIRGGTVYVIYVNYPNFDFSPMNGYSDVIGKVIVGVSTTGATVRTYDIDQPSQTFDVTFPTTITLATTKFLGGAVGNFIDPATNRLGFIAVKNGQLYHV